jgi:hydrogenase maturation protease
MTTTVRAGPGRSTAARPRASGPGHRILVEILVCGSLDRGDDAAALAAVPAIRAALPSDARLKVVGMLDIDDLLAVARGAGAVIVDAAVGIPPGRILTLPLTGLIGREGLQPRSSHALAFREVIGLAELLRGVPMVGQIVAVGASRFTPGKPLSRLVSAAIPALVEATLAAAERTRLAVAVTPRW